MKSRALRMGSIGVIGMACITLMTFAESPAPQSPYAPAGWYWTGDGVWCQLPIGPCYGDWDDPDNWEWRGIALPSWNYPQKPQDDVYLTWTISEPLIVYLTTEEIDALEIHGTAVVPTKSLTFESKGSDPQILSCDHLTLRATNGDLVITVTDRAGIKTVD